MIYLIGGSPRVGKSILSSKLSKEINVPYICTDELRLIVLAYFKGNERKERFPFIDFFDLEKFFKHYTAKQMIKADKKEAASIWPGIKSLIDHLLLFNTNYIIEGAHLLPCFVKDYKDNKNVKIIFLSKLDDKKIYRGLLRYRNKGDWIAGNVKDKKIILLAAKLLSEYGHLCASETKRYDLKCINTEDNFYKKLNQGLKYLLRK